MNAVWASLAQLIMISIAYPAACLAAATFAVVAILGIDPAELGEATWPQLVEIAIYLATTTLRALTSAFWPALVAAALAEGLKVRGLVPYLVAGCVVGLVRALPIAASMSGEAAPPLDGAAVQLSVAGGAVGGFVYWLIAGRSAGRWLELRWFEEHRWR
ncbi:hypothetical protein [Acuticoccus sp.]|uniref:hypothetical protein n=1 Tax=Acuticoccus sp. TaxID=1904378 RepID=UPI003B52AEE3